MRVKLVLIERDFRGKELLKREEILCGDSVKNPTRNYVARLIARHHPELRFAGKIFLINASEEGHKWYVKAIQLDPNRWLYAYADPLDEISDIQTKTEHSPKER